MSKIHFLNVGEGDCSIIEHENGHISMIDICCGNQPSEVHDDVIKSLCVESFGIKGNFNQKAHPTNPIEYLSKWGIKTIFRYIQTHPDMDHMDGLNKLYEKFDILNFWDTANNKTQSFDNDGNFGVYKKEDWDCYCKLRKSYEQPKSLIFYDGDSYKYYAEDENGVKSDDFIKILSPTKTLISNANTNQDWNDSSYVLLYKCHGFKILFCGDADVETSKHLIDNHSSDISNIDILIAPHHGRDSDKDFYFLDVMKPKLTLFGNAKSKFLAYDEWNSRNLLHITNNQAGNVLIDITNNVINIAVSNKKFADDFCKANWGNFSNQFVAMTDYWAIGRLPK